MRRRRRRKRESLEFQSGISMMSPLINNLIDEPVRDIVGRSHGTGSNLSDTQAGGKPFHVVSFCRPFHSRFPLATPLQRVYLMDLTEDTSLQSVHRLRAGLCFLPRLQSRQLSLDLLRRGVIDEFRWCRVPVRRVAPVHEHAVLLPQEL
jgi:hypothetical protein